MSQENQPKGRPYRPSGKRLALADNVMIPMKQNEIQNVVYRLSGRSRRSPPALRAAVNGARSIISTHTSQCHERSHKRRVSSLLPVHIDRHLTIQSIQ